MSGFTNAWRGLKKSVGLGGPQSSDEEDADMPEDMSAQFLTKELRYPNIVRFDYECKGTNRSSFIDLMNGMIFEKRETSNMLRRPYRCERILNVEAQSPTCLVISFDGATNITKAAKRSKVKKYTFDNPSMATQFSSYVLHRNRYGESMRLAFLELSTRFQPVDPREDPNRPRLLDMTKPAYFENIAHGPQDLSRRENAELNANHLVK
jgi:hypothetical protein